MKINGNEIPKEILAKAMACDTPEELMMLAKGYGFELTAQEAEAYLDEIEDIDLDFSQLKMVSGGYINSDGPCYTHCGHRTCYGH